MSCVVHICFGMSPDFGGRPFSFCHYLSVRSAWERLQPERIVLHYVHCPSGPWWDRARPMLTLHQLPAIEGIYGFPASHPAHRADIVRLVALLVMGGVYLDTDVLVLRSFDALGSPSFAAALEVTANGDLIGLSNAILLAQPRSTFARLCLEGHDPERSLWQGFRSRGRDHNYVEMSVRYPAMLASLVPGLLEVLPTATFLSIDWQPETLAALFEGQADIPSDALALHLWESHAWDPHLSRITPEWVRSSDSTFARLARPFLPEAPGRPLPAQPLGLSDNEHQQMALLLAEVNRVAPCHRTSLHRRLWRQLRATASLLRDAWHSPVQARLDQLPAPSEFQPVPPPAPSPQNRDASWARCGSLDGSWELIRPHLPEPPCSALLLTDSLGEPSACAALARNPGSSVLWVSDSLPRAVQLAAWMQGQGIDGRTIHHPHSDPQLIPRLAHQQFTATPTLLLLGPTPHLQPLLEALITSDVRPDLLLITLRVGSTALHPALTPKLDGPTAERLVATLQSLGYQRLASSGDHQFQLLRRQGASVYEPAPQQRGRLIPPLRMHSLYGDPVTL